MREQLLARGSSMAWVADFGPWTLKVIGALVVMGAIGLVALTLTGGHPR